MKCKVTWRGVLARIKLTPCDIGFVRVITMKVSSLKLTAEPSPQKSSVLSVVNIMIHKVTLKEG